MANKLKFLCDVANCCMCCFEGSFDPLFISCHIPLIPNLQFCGFNLFVIEEEECIIFSLDSCSCFKEINFGIPYRKISGITSLKILGGKF